MVAEKVITLMERTQQRTGFVPVLPGETPGMIANKMWRQLTSV